MTTDPTAKSVEPATTIKPRSRKGRDWGEAVAAAFVLAMAVVYAIREPEQITGWRQVVVLVMICAAVAALLRVFSRKPPEPTDSRPQIK